MWYAQEFHKHMGEFGVEGFYSTPNRTLLFRQPVGVFLYFFSSFFWHSKACLTKLAGCLREGIFSTIFTGKIFHFNSVYFICAYIAVVLVLKSSPQYSSGHYMFFSPSTGHFYKPNFPS